MAFKKGHPGMGGRPKGIPNKITREVREFMASLVNDVEVQEAIKARIKSGKDLVGFFKCAEHIMGKPKETISVEVAKPMFVLDKEPSLGLGLGEDVLEATPVLEASLVEKEKEEI